MKDFGNTENGRTAHLFTIEDGALKASVSDYGATLISFMIETEKRSSTDVLLGYDSVAGYEHLSGCMGAVIGRCANRTGGAAFKLNGRLYRLAANDHGNNLHSGPDTYFRRFWTTDGTAASGNTISFGLHSPDGDQGYPGNMDITVTYSINEKDGLRIEYRAESDADTVCSMTNHAFFNLNGQGNGDILDHQLEIYADRITRADEESIPDGTFIAVQDTPFDFLKMKKIGQDIDADDPMLKSAGGYDQNFVLSDSRRAGLFPAAKLVSETSGLAVDVSTDLPGLQFYSGNYLTLRGGKNGSTYNRRSGLALETQYFPNALNIPSFPQPVLKAGEVFMSSTVYRLYSI